VKIEEFGQRMKAELSRALVGQERVIDQVLACALAGGHVLMEGVPGLAKTLLGRAMAQALGGEFRRIQFTPDLMPSDVVGTELYLASTGAFEIKRGPVFTDVLLADEINRTPPKTQSALLECMQERTATISGQTLALSGGFLVLATQNPVEYEGTYPLPEAQLDRFMLKVLVDYPSAPEELAILQRYAEGQNPLDFAQIGLKAVSSLAELLHCRAQLPSLRVEPPVLEYINEIVRATRGFAHIQLGASPRAAIALLQVSRALAALRGHDYVSPDDIKEMAAPVLRHRVLLRAEAQMEGYTADKVVVELLETVKVPR
jgi:MoxR-like ATPase